MKNVRISSSSVGSMEIHLKMVSELMRSPGSSKATPLPFLRGILGLPTDNFWAC